MMGRKTMFNRLAFIPVIALCMTVVPLATTSAASAYPNGTVVFSGHGHGHGRGLSQYGALGYAVNYGWDWPRILNHYYGNTEMGDHGNVSIGVRLDAVNGKDTIVISDTGYTVGGMTFDGGSAALIRRDGANHFAVYKGAGCGGGWSSRGGVAGDVQIVPSASEGDQGDRSTMMRLCANDRAYRGSMEVKDVDGIQHTINTVLLENYLRGVVPREMSASWGSYGDGKGMHALRAQAVAARTYALISRFSYATQCDTTSCQVYGGAYLGNEHIEYPLSDRAIADTSGKVRKRNGALISTEFSSSSGGYTAEDKFPAVIDEGDAVAQNSRHNWTVSVPVSTIEAAYPTVGSLQSIQVVRRNGLGDFGGRARDVVVKGSNGSVTTTGEGVRVKLGYALYSDWWRVMNQPSGGIGGHHLLASDGGIFAFGNAQFYGSMGGKPLNKPIVGMTRTNSARGYWNVASDGGIFSFGDAQFYGSMGGKPLNSPMVAMAANPNSAGGYWTVAADGGIFSFGGAQFYGSMGGKPLNKPIVGMAPTPTGKGYWLVAADGGIFSFGDAQFSGSTGGMRLNSPIVAMAARTKGPGYWLVAADGGVFAFGGAGFYGSGGDMRLSSRVSGLTATATENGYSMVTENGTIYSFGDAPHFGDMGSVANWSGSIRAISSTLE